MHTSVLLHEAINALNVAPNKKYIDATYGTGGHTQEIVSRGGAVLAIDWDEENVLIKNEELRIKNEKNLKLVWGNFANIEEIAQSHDFSDVDGILFDFGLSMEQIGQAGRGFSFKKHSEPLDMRISKKGLTKTAADIINSSSADELYEIFSRNSQEVDSRAVAQNIFRASRTTPIKTVGDFLLVLDSVESNMRSKKEHLYRKIFQAIRMEVNKEIENIKNGMKGAQRLISETGIIAIITFHQTEDRVVKQEAKTLGLKQLHKKPIIAKNDNRFEQSAKLRVYTKQI